MVEGPVFIESSSGQESEKKEKVRSHVIKNKCVILAKKEKKTRLTQKENKQRDKQKSNIRVT